MKLKFNIDERWRSSTICQISLVLSVLPILATGSGSNHIRNNQEPPGELVPNSGDQNYDTSDPADPNEERLEPPNELSVIRFNDTSVVLRWEFPDSFLSSLENFKVQYKSSQKNSTWKTELNSIEPMVRAYQIYGLRPGNYFFIVAAQYENQDSVSSKPLKFKLRAKSKIPPEDLPETKAPEIFWNETGKDYFRFKWHYNPKPNDQDYGFLVYYRSTFRMDAFTIYHTMEMNVEIVEVPPDTSYEAKVIAHNEHGVSEFSSTITLRTKPQTESSTTPSPITSSRMTTQMGTLEQSSTKSPFTYGMSTDVTENLTKSTTTRAPKQDPPTPKSEKWLPQWLESIYTFFKPVFSDQSDAMLVIRYLLLVLLPVLFLTFGLVLCLRPYNNKKNCQVSSSTVDAQFDLEINCYFKNSFPGVEEGYSSVINRGS